jgi:hypothetical protein
MLEKPTTAREAPEAVELSRGTLLAALAGAAVPVVVWWLLHRLSVCRYTICEYGSYVVEGVAYVRAAATSAVLLVLLLAAEGEFVKQLESPAPIVNCEEAESVNIGMLRPEPTEYVQIQTMPQYHHPIQVQPRRIHQRPILGSK